MCTRLNKKKKKSITRFSDLPEELVVEILALLPADSLLHSKCVQKSWYALIENPRFVVKQLRNQIINKDTCILLLYKHNVSRYLHGKKHDLYFCFFNDKTGTAPGDDNPFAIGKIRLYEHGKFENMSGHSHGIICLSFKSGTIILANPAIRESGTVGVGFGYDPKSNDYKVIRFMRLSPYMYSPTRVEVYTLSTDSWRELNRKVLCGVEDSFSVVTESDCKYINGACYWVQARVIYEKRRYFVLSFDMSDEVFQKISMPNYTVSKDFRLVVFNESLAVVMHNLIRGTYALEIWVLNVIGRTWSKLLMVRPNPRLRRPLAFWKNVDELIMEDKNGFVCCYNLVTQEIRNLLPVERHRIKFVIVNYMSSLVSVRGGNKVDTAHHNLTKI